MNKMVKKQMPKIVVDHGEKQNLVREFSTSFQYVRQSLGGEKITPTALAIRAKAIELGGIEIEEKNKLITR